MHWLYDDITDAAQVPGYEDWEAAARSPSDEIIKALHNKWITPAEVDQVVNACAAIFFASMMTAQRVARSWHHRPLETVEPTAEDLLVQAAHNARYIPRPDLAIRKPRASYRISDTIQKSTG